MTTHTPKYTHHNKKVFPILQKVPLCPLACYISPPPLASNNHLPAFSRSILNLIFYKVSHEWDHTYGLASVFFLLSMFSRFIYVVVCIDSPLLFTAEWYVTQCIYYPIEGPLSNFQFEAIVHTAVMNILVQVFV